jgi:predicted metalloprotease with PDZ domain
MREANSCVDTGETMVRLLFLTAGLLPSLAFSEVHYSLQIKPSDRKVSVSVQLSSPAKEETFRIPTWCPGYYQVADYQNAISKVTATDSAGNALQIDHKSSRAWTVEDPGQRPYTLTYNVLGDDLGLGFFAVCVHDHDAFINGAATFMTADERKLEPTTLHITTPVGWDVATPMDRDAQGDYVAGGYDELLDSPIQLGRFARKKFEVDQIPFEAIFVSPDGVVNPDVDAETERLRKLSAPAIALFKTAPFKHYTYFFHLAVGSFSGGLEHRASTVIAYPNVRPLNIDDLVTHEYFHAWNVKQIRPVMLGPFDYTQPVRTNNLWFAEGVTDYYAKKTAYATGLEDTDWLLSQLGSTIANLQQGTTRKTVTLEQSSHEAWENGEEGVGDLSYYDKGLLVGLLLDAEVRSRTNGAKSLDDVMRLLYERHHLPLPGYGEEELRAVISEVAGTDLSDIYNRMVASTQELPYDGLKSIGLRVLQPGQSYTDVGFKVNGSGTVVSVADPNRVGGIVPGDNVSVSSQDGDSVTYSVKHGETASTARIVTHSANADAYMVEFDPLATDDARKRLNEWLGK